MSQKINVLCFGDSLTEGYPFGDTYTAFLAEGSGGLVSPVEEHFGVSGESTEEIRSRLHRHLTPSKEDEPKASKQPPKTFVVIQGGTNDLGTGVPATEIVDNLTAMCREAVSLGYPVVACTVPPLSFDVEKQYRSLAKGRSIVNDAIKALALQFPPTHFCVYDFAAQVSRVVEIQKADSTEEIVALRDDLRSDSIHLTPEGYKLMGLGIAKALTELIQRSESAKAPKD